MRRAVFYMTLSALMFTVVNFVIRSVDHIPTIQLIFFRSLGSVICGVYLLKKLNISMKGNNPPMLLLRGIVGLISMFLFYKAMQMMPIASAVSLRYSSPIFATFLALFLLKEKVIPWQWFFLFAAFIGIVMLKGFDTRITLAGFALIMTSAFFSGMVYTIIRKIGTSEHPIVIVNYFMVVSLIIGSIGALFNWTEPTLIEWAMLLSMGLFGFGAQYYMTMALQLGEANVVTPFKYLEAIFTLIIGWIVFGEYQTLLSIAAMIIIVLSLIGNVWIKSKYKKTQTVSE